MRLSRQEKELIFVALVEETASLYTMAVEDEGTEFAEDSLAKYEEAKALQGKVKRDLEKK